jgi:hypothetical protein
MPWKSLLQHLPAPLQAWGTWLKPIAVTAIFLQWLALVVTLSYNPFLYFRF